MSFMDFGVVCFASIDIDIALVVVQSLQITAHVSGPIGYRLQ